MRNSVRDGQQGIIEEDLVAGDDHVIVEGKTDVTVEVIFVVKACSSSSTVVKATASPEINCAARSESPCLVFA